MHCQRFSISLTVYLVLIFGWTWQRQPPNKLPFANLFRLMYTFAKSIQPLRLHILPTFWSGAFSKMCRFVRSCYYRFNPTSKLKFPCKHVIDARLLHILWNTIRLQRPIPIAYTYRSCAEFTMLPKFKLDLCQFIEINGSEQRLPRYVSTRLRFVAIILNGSSGSSLRSVAELIVIVPVP